MFYHGLFSVHDVLTIVRTCMDALASCRRLRAKQILTLNQLKILQQTFLLIIGMKDQTCLLLIKDLPFLQWLAVSLHNYCVCFVRKTSCSRQNYVKHKAVHKLHVNASKPSSYLTITLLKMLNRRKRRIPSLKTLLLLKCNTEWDLDFHKARKYPIVTLHAFCDLLSCLFVQLCLFRPVVPFTLKRSQLDRHLTIYIFFE